MAEIRPRWEWRAFGQRFGNAEARLAKLAPGGVQESDEVYLLSGAGDNVKVRDKLMDIKVLREVDGDGLEQWTPVMKAEFPLSAATAGAVLAALRDAAERWTAGGAPSDDMTFLLVRAA